MRKSELMALLFNEGNPIIRYLVATKLARTDSGYNMDRLREEMLATNDAVYWLDCLETREGLGRLHGSKDVCFENALGKLISFGLRSGDRELDQATEGFIHWLEGEEKEAGDRLMEPIVGSFLAGAGYGQADAVARYWERRIDLIYEFVKERSYSIFADKSQFKGIPVPFRDKPLVDPSLYQEGRLRLPWIYDMLAFTALRDESERPELSAKIDAIAEYVIDTRYQEFSKGYGVILLEPRHYYALGWAVWLPGHRGLEMDAFEAGAFLQRMVIMSHFPSARSSEWFQNSLAHLEGFRTERDTHLFPREYLAEKKNSYFITGGHMGLGEDRRMKSWRELESTFWMLALRSNI